VTHSEIWGRELSEEEIVDEFSSCSLETKEADQVCEWKESWDKERT